MDYKKKFEDFLDKMQGLLDSAKKQGHIIVRVEDIENTFPELKESEDESVRKELINIMNLSYDCGIAITKENRDRYIAWLEKQGVKQSLPIPNERAWLYLVADVLTWKDGIGQYLDDPRVQKLAKKLSSEYAQKLYTFPVSSDIENNKQETDDKVEPKFKVGDWITDGEKVWNIGYIEDDMYIEHHGSISAGGTIESIDKRYHLWTIQDAKDGDVLVDEDNNIGLYHEEKYSLDDWDWESYIYLGCDNRLYGFSLGGYHSIKNTKPATKEQSDLLFQKMKEKGYEWDAEKKELKKTELHNSYKLEPNFDFSVGQWIVVPIAKKVFLITKIEGFGITLVDIDGDEYVFGVDSLKDARLWTVADAKEGDVLSNGKMIVLFKHFEEPSYKQHIVAYIGLDAIGAIQITDDAWYLGIGKTYPATKEQRELLFQKMKKAGYEWDAENKELKKIEPKFKAGNWYQCTKDFFGKGVTFDKNTAYYCAKEGCLQCEYGCHIAIVKDLYDNFKLWTISDAKDGDVLYSLDSNQPFIYKARNGYEQATAYCGLNIYGKFFVWDTKDCVITLNNYVPATKEQRDALLKAMADAGYEWDVKKKELKKIKQKQAIDCIDSHPKDNWELVHEFVETFGRMPEDEDELNVLVEYVLKRQKPTEWNEEDDYNLQCMIAKAVKDIQNGNVGRNQELINWLKSIKDRVQHQKQWKPSEEQLEFLKKCIESYNEVSFPTEFRLFRSLYNDLKKLTE